MRVRGLTLASFSLALGIAFVSSACSTQSVPLESANGPTDRPPEAMMEIVTGDGTFIGYEAARLDVGFGRTPMAQFWVSGGRGNEGWRVFASMRPEQVVSGAVSVAVIDGTKQPLSEGMGEVRRGVVGDAGVDTSAATGTLEFTIGKGKIAGSVRGTGMPRLDASFHGSGSVMCSVPASFLGVSDAGGIIPNDGQEEPLSLDGTFTTPQCAPFKSIGF